MKKRLGIIAGVVLAIAALVYFLSLKIITRLALLAIKTLSIYQKLSTTMPITRTPSFQPTKIPAISAKKLKEKKTRQSSFMNTLTTLAVIALKPTPFLIKYSKSTKGK